MASIYSWEGFIRIHGGEPGARDVFEKAMDELLRAENPGKEVHVVKASQGDGGIDVYIHQEDGIDIYQCKFFMGSMNPSRWSQIKDSFSKAMKPKGVKVLRWVLCMPREMQKEDIAEWDAFKKDRESYGVEIQFADGNEIIYRMRDCDRDRGTDLIERYFDESKRGHKGIYAIPKCLTDYVPAPPEIELVGRDDIVNKVRAMLDQSAQIALVSGLGGIGKTAVMQKVCESILSDGIEENHVAWIVCGDSLEDDLLALRDALGVSKGYDRENACAAVIRELKTFPGTLYLFMDDMARMPGKKELGTLASLRPNVRIMITSRHEIAGIPCLDLKVLQKDDAVEMFYGYYRRDDERKYVADARKIIESDSVKRHTLLVELLAKAANRYISSGTLDEFRKELEEKGFFKVSKGRYTSAHDENLTIEESVTKLYGISELSPEQKRIMSLFSIFTPEKVIYGKVVEWAGVEENDVDDLVQLGWLIKAEGGYVIHQIVRDSIARQVGDSLKIEEYGELIEEVAATKNYMSVELGYTKVRERLVLAEDVSRSVNGRIKEMLEVGGWTEADETFLQFVSVLLNNLAGVYEDQGEYEKALEYYGKALEVAERVLGNDHPLTATTYNNMAGVYKAQGDYEKALEYYGKALEVAERVLGNDHPLTATMYNNMALVYQAQGDYEKALEYYGKALEVRERVLGRDHPYTATAYNNMAGVYKAQGDYEKALEYNRKSLEVRERVLGRDHPDTATTYNNMAEVYRAQGEYEKALEYNRKSLEVRERVLGRDHPDTAATYNNMAVVYEAQGEYEKALEYYDKALEVRERVLGSEHPSTATTYNNMAGVYQDQGEYEKALEYFGKALEVNERVLGRDHPSTAATYNNMAVVYKAQGEYEKALEYYVKALEVVERVLGSDHPNTAATYNNMAVVYKAQGEYEKALEHYGKALEVRERVLGGDHPDTAATYNNMALVYKAQGEYEKALDYYERALTVFKAKLGVNHRYTQITQRSVQHLKSLIKLD